jgi:hypothetical protein
MSMSRLATFRDTGERFRSLRTIATIFTMLGAVLLALGTLLLAHVIYRFLAGSITQPSPPIGAPPVPQPGLTLFGAGMTWLILLWSFALLLGGLQSIAAGALFRLFINLEGNTRASAQCLDRIRARIEAQGDEFGQFFRS